MTKHKITLYLKSQQSIREFKNLVQQLFGDVNFNKMEIYGNTGNQPWSIDTDYIFEDRVMYTAWTSNNKPGASSPPISFYSETLDEWLNKLINFVERSKTTYLSITGEYKEMETEDFVPPEKSIVVNIDHLIKPKIQKLKLVK